jgi:preprotein translocase subunit YajC
MHNFDCNLVINNITNNNKMTFLNFILCDAMQDAGAPVGNPQGGGMSMIIMLLLMGVVFYFFMIRPQQKRQKELQTFRDGLQKGDKVMTVGGIHGVISGMTETTFLILIAENVEISVEKSSVVADTSDTTGAQEAAGK